MAKFSINRVLSPSILPKIPKFSLFRTLSSSSADIYYTHLQNNTSKTERALSNVKKANLDTSSVKQVLHKLSPTQSLLGLRFFIWAGVQSNYRHSSYMYSKACNLFGINKNPKLFGELIEAYREEGFSITAKMFQIVLNLCREGKLADEGLWVLNKMKELGIRPDTTAYNIVIRLFCQKGGVDVATELMREMGSFDLYPDMVTYITMIKGFCELGRLKDACVLFRIMKEHGCVPNLVAYSALLDGVCRFGNLEKALELLEEMERESEDCRPNVVTYTTMIQVFCERGRTMEALSVLDRMKACGCTPNRVTVSVLIKGFCAEGLLEKAHKLIDRVVSDGSVSGSECYSSLVISLMRLGEIFEAENLFRRMLASEIKPDGLASSMIMKGICSKGKVLDVFYIYKEIEKSGYSVSIDLDIYSIILDGLCREHCLAEVLEFARLCADKNIQLRAPYMENIVAYLKKSGQEELVSLLTSTRK